jgi:hypothetical protein
MADKLKNLIAGCALVVVSGCGYGPISDLQKQQARENGVIIYCNGFLSDETRKMTGEVAEDLDMAHFPDRRDIRELLEDGENSQYGNHLVFHSAGADDAYGFSNWCNSNRIEIRTAHSLDAFTDHNFPRNILEMNNYFSSMPYAFGKQISRGGINSQFTSVSNSNHLNLPWKVKQTIKNSIVNQRRERAYQRIPRRSGR